jgi:anti-sigma factor RsiW
MHQVIVDGLEDYLSGNPSREFEKHLAACPDCRRELVPFEECSELFRVLGPCHEVKPAAGFAARVMNRVAEPPASSFWNVFSFEPAFFRRVAFASLVLLAALGGILVTQESSYVANSGPERLISAETMSDGPPAAHRERMLVRLASYRQ